MVHVTVPADDDARKLAFDAMQKSADEFNNNFKKIGVMRVFASMDGVTKVLHMFVDDLGALQESLKQGEANTK